MVISVLAACNRNTDDLDQPLPPGLGGDTWVKGTIDYWIYDSLIKPYNINAKYKWDPWEVALDKALTPPREEMVIPALQALVKIWIEPYNEVTGSSLFIKNYAPKEIVLIGSPQFNANGTAVLGQAEGANKIILFVINYFNKTNMAQLRRMLHTIQHEFAHILHQNKLYPVAYKSLSTGYTNTWFNISNRESLNKGFITPYAMASPDEDFVEMVATMLIEGPERFNELLELAPLASKEILLKKQAMVIEYFSTVWRINFMELQTKVQNALKSIAVTQAVNQVFGFDKDYTSLTYSSYYSKPFNLSGTFFKQQYAQVQQNITNYNNTLQLDSLSMVLTTASQAGLVLYISQAGSTFQAVYYYNYVINPDGSYKFSYTGSNPNGTLLVSTVTPLVNYFGNYNFSLSWLDTPEASIQPKILMDPQNLPDGKLVTHVQ